MSKLVQFVALIIIIFLLVALFVSVLAIWDIVPVEEAVDALTKTAYSAGAVVVVGACVALVASMMGKKK